MAEDVDMDSCSTLEPESVPSDPALIEDDRKMDTAEQQNGYVPSLKHKEKQPQVGF